MDDPNRYSLTLEQLNKLLPEHKILVESGLSITDPDIMRELKRDIDRVKENK